VAGVGGRTPEALAAFLERVRSLVRRYPATGLPESSMLEAPAEADEVVAPNFTLLNPVVPLRWFEPDAGGTVSLRFNPAGPRAGDRAPVYRACLD
jgi:hypothetical protein